MNSNFISNIFGLTQKPTDILSAVSDSVPIIYTSTVSTPDNLATTTTSTTTYNARFFCLGNLLIQFNDSANTSIVSSAGPLPFPYPYGDTPYSVVSSNYYWPITFTKSAINLLANVSATNFNFLSIGPRPSLFYPTVPFLTEGSPQISVSSGKITFIFNQNGSIKFYRSGTITSYTAIGAGGVGGAGGGGTSGTAGGGGGGGGGGLTVYSTTPVTCELGSIITVVCGTSNNGGNTTTTCTSNPENTLFSTKYILARVGNNGSGGVGGGYGGAGANSITVYGQGGANSSASGGAGRNAQPQLINDGSGQYNTQSIISGGGGGGAFNGGNGGAGGGGMNIPYAAAGSGGGGAGGKNSNAGSGGAGGTPVAGGVAGGGGKGGNSGPTIAGSNGGAGGGGGGGGAGGAETSNSTSTTLGGAGGLGGSGRVVFVIEFSS